MDETLQGLSQYICLGNLVLRKNYTELRIQNVNYFYTNDL